MELIIANEVRMQLLHCKVCILCITYCDSLLFPPSDDNEFIKYNKVIEIASYSYISGWA